MAAPQFPALLFKYHGCRSREYLKWVREAEPGQRAWEMFQAVWADPVTRPKRFYSCCGPSLLQHLLVIHTPATHILCWDDGPCPVHPPAHCVQILPAASGWKQRNRRKLKEESRSKLNRSTHIVSELAAHCLTGSWKLDKSSPASSKGKFVTFEQEITNF